jgi:zinc transport system substrate-binding protein
MNRWVVTNLLAIGIGLFLANVSCSPGAYASEKKVRAFVSILPQAYFVERIGGEHVEVEVMVGPGQSPETYEASPRQMARLSRADVYFQIRVPFEARLIQGIAGSFPELKRVDTTAGITLRHLAHGHHHGDADDDHADQQDPHTWLDPSLAKIQSKNICDALCELDPGHGEFYRANLKALIEDLDTAKEKLSQALSPWKGRSFYVFHPAFGYFGDAFGLKQVAVETGGKEPSAKGIAGLIRQAQRDRVQLIFVQPQFSKKSAEAIAGSIGGAVVEMDPLSRDYLKNLDEIATKISQSVGQANVDSGVRP